jgi:hypothetical protein
VVSDNPHTCGGRGEEELVVGPRFPAAVVAALKKEGREGTWIWRRGEVVVQGGEVGEALIPITAMIETIDTIHCNAFVLVYVTAPFILKSETVDAVLAETRDHHQSVKDTHE